MTRRFLRMGLVAVLVACSMVGTALAGDPGTGPGTVPQTMDPDNPYTQQVVAAQQALDQSIAQFWQDDYTNPWDFGTLEADYQAYVDAWYAFQSALSLYWQWEQNNRSFSGRVMSTTPCPPQPPQPPFFPCDPAILPVQGASVDLMPMPIPYATALGSAGPGAPSTSATVVTTSSGAGTSGPAGASTGVIFPQPIGPYHAVTDGSGMFKIFPVPQGTYQYTVTHPDYETATGTITIAGSSVQQTIMLVRKAARGFSGHVLSRDFPWQGPGPDPLSASGQTQTAPAPGGASTSIAIFPRGHPLAGAEIVVRRSPPILIPLAAGRPSPAPAQGNAIASPYWGEWKQVSDANGAFNFAGLPEGEFQYTVTYQDYTPASGQFTLTQGVVTRDIFLTHQHELSGTVLTPAPRIWPILQPLIASTGGASSTADAVRQKLDAIPNLPVPGPERLVPVDGATVTVSAQVIYPLGDQPAAGTPSNLVPERFGETRSMVTGSDGHFDFGGLRWTTYQVTVTKDGYIAFKGSLTLTGATTPHDIVIFPVFQNPPPVPLEQKVVPATGASSLENPFAK